MPTSKRDRLAHQLDQSGALRFLEGIALRRGLLVVNYHRIGNCENNQFDDGVFSASAEVFEAQVVYLRKHFRLLTLPELLESSRTGFQFPEPCALITFDDGYRDNFDLAFPILRKHNTSAVFFVPTDYIENPHLPWWDHIAYVVKTTKCRTLALPTDPPVTIDLTATSRKDAIFQILRAFKTANKANEAGFLAQLEETAQVQVDRTTLGRELFMSWNDLRQMVAAGMSIGSHTHTHQILAQLSEPQQRHELKLSKEILQDRLQQPVDSISYPVGGLDKFTATTKKLCKESGYQAGFSFYGGVNRPGQTDSLDIKRIGIDYTEPPGLTRTRIVLTAALGKSF
jgi:peptidoglycan/xylan/chitin deacetylase (PgdA/CDA1 family)